MYMRYPENYTVVQSDWIGAPTTVPAAAMTAVTTPSVKLPSNERLAYGVDGTRGTRICYIRGKGNVANTASL